MSEPAVINIDMSEQAFRARKLRRLIREFDRIPAWVLEREGIQTGTFDTGRDACSQNHLFVNAKSRYCHQCGEAR